MLGVVSQLISVAEGMELAVEAALGPFLHAVVVERAETVFTSAYAEGDRLRLPVVTTASKLSAEEDNQTELEQFIAECCEKTPEKHTPFAEFYDRFQQWLPANEKHAWSKKRVSKELPVRHSRIVGYGNQKYVSHLTLMPAKEGGRK